MRKIDIERSQITALNELEMAKFRLVSYAVEIYNDKEPSEEEVERIAWMASMTVIEVHSIWERYAERRLLAALNRHPDYFIKENDIKGVKHVSQGLGDYIVRGGRSYFDFRNVDDLKKKARDLVGADYNPFKDLQGDLKKRLDALTAIRNRIAHGSASSIEQYGATLFDLYGLSNIGKPDKFLWAIDNKPGPGKGKARIIGLIEAIQSAVEATTPS